MCDHHEDLTNHVPTSRRDVLRVGAAAAIAALGGVAWAADPPKPGAAPPPNAIAPADAMKRLLDGNARYVANAPREKDFSAGRAARAQAQYPFAAILSCADSRVAPELAFDEGPGELFVVRVAGNFVNPDLLASLEYGVQFLGVPFIFVLGHSKCGAVDAAIKVLKAKAALPGHLPDLVTALKPAVIVAEKTKSGDLLDNAIAENVRRQVAGLKAAKPVIAKFYAEKKIDIAGGVYDLETGKITVL
ncbi:MAG TPA: carbonic anhydrase [Casimicrobiaceae bacterium]|nr:carbonic anhydrase [Casimicrobiaceae bacterium]